MLDECQLHLDGLEAAAESFGDFLKRDLLAAKRLKGVDFVTGPGHALTWWFC